MTYFLILNVKYLKNHLSSSFYLRVMYQFVLPYVIKSQLDAIKSVIKAVWVLLLGAVYSGTLKDTCYNKRVLL